MVGSHSGTLAGVGSNSILGWLEIGALRDSSTVFFSDVFGVPKKNNIQGKPLSKLRLKLFNCFGQRTCPSYYRKKSVFQI